MTLLVNHAHKPLNPLPSMLKTLIKMPLLLIYNLTEKYYKLQSASLAEGSHFLKLKVPFFAKWESPKLAASIRSGKISAKDDPMWEESGAKDQAEYESYSWQICGMACLKMILTAINKTKEYRAVSLAKEAEKYGVYKKNKSVDPKNNLDGMFHSPFLEFIKTFGLLGFKKTQVQEYQLSHYINDQLFILASVQEDFTAPKTHDPLKKGGHLVVMVGFEVKDKKVTGFYINNPSGKFGENQEYFFIDIETWKNTFSGNILCLFSEIYSSRVQPE